MISSIVAWFLLLHKWEKWDSEKGINCLDSCVPARTGPRPPAARPECFLMKRLTGHCFSSPWPRLAQPLSPITHKAAFPVHPLGKPRALMQIFWGLSIFPEYICFSRRQSYPQMLKSPLETPCGVPETAPHQEAGESLLGWFPTYACLTKQCWFSANFPPCLLIWGWPGALAVPSPLRPQGNVTRPVSTTAFSPCSSKTGKGQTPERP